MLLMTKKEAINRAVIQKHYQPMWKCYMWSADGCGDNLYRTAGFALIALKFYQLSGIVMTQYDIDTEHA